MITEMDSFRVIVFGIKETLNKLKAVSGLRIDFLKIKRNRRLIYL